MNEELLLGLIDQVTSLTPELWRCFSVSAHLN